VVLVCLLVIGIFANLLIRALRRRFRRA
jgi:hypothetical protein